MNKRTKKTLFHLPGQIILAIAGWLVFDVLGWWAVLGALVGIGLYWLFVAMFKADWSAVIDLDFDSDHSSSD